MRTYHNRPGIQIRTKQSKCLKFLDFQAVIGRLAISKKPTKGGVKMEINICNLKWRFAGSSYRWGSNGSDNLWVTELPGGEKVYFWGWEADPRDEEGGYSSYYSLVPPKEVWDGNYPQGFDTEDGVEVFQDLYEVLEYLGYKEVAEIVF